MNKDEQVLLMSCEFLEKLISSEHEFIAADIVKVFCSKNLRASEKVAFVLLRGITKSNYDTLQPYLSVLHEFVLIDDDYQDMRIKWVIGKQTLAVSAFSKKIQALASYSF